MTRDPRQAAGFVGSLPSSLATGPAGGRIGRILWCVEMLEGRGWHPVAWELTHPHNWVGVVLVRVG